MFCLVDKTKGLILEDSLSDSSEGLLWRGKGGAGYIGVLQQKPASRNIKRLLLIKENQTSQVNESSMLFCVREEARVWAHWNHSFEMHLNYLGPVSCFPPSWIPSGCRVGGGCSGWGLLGCNILGLLIWQVTFFIHKLNQSFSHQVKWPRQVPSSFKRTNYLEDKPWNILKTTEIKALPSVIGHHVKCFWALLISCCRCCIIILPTAG